ncbi:hypothetical protein ACFXAP_001651, partial [Vibrio cholerae]
MAKSPFRAGRSLDALYENVEILTGQRGNGLYRAVTEKDVASIKGTVNKIVVGSNNSGSGTEIVEVPHAPANVQVFGGFSAILVQWDNPTFRGYAHAEVWRATDNNLSHAVRIATTPANVFSDVVNTGSTFFYWVRFINKANVAGPYHNVNGVKAVTSPDIADIIDELAEQLRNSVLVKELQSSIDTKATQASLDQAKVELASADNALQSGLAATNQSLNQAKTELLQADLALKEGLEATNQSLSQAVSELAQADLAINSGLNHAQETINQTKLDLQQAKDQLDKAIASTDAALKEAAGSLSQADADLDLALQSAKSALDGELARIEDDYKSADTKAYTNIKQLESALADTSKVLALQISQLNAAYETQNDAQAAHTSAQITEAKKVLADADQALAEIVRGLESSMILSDKEIRSSLSSLEQALTTADQALSQRLDQLDAAYK